MSKQLTSQLSCKRKHTYYSAKNARMAKRRRNKAAGIAYLRSYECNVCSMWHVTTQKKDEGEE